MSVKNSVDKTMTALENGKTRMVGLYDVISGLSVKSKANLDVRLKSDKSVFPVWKKSVSWDKEMHLMPVIWVMTAMLAVWTALKIGKHCG